MNRLQLEAAKMNPRETAAEYERLKLRAAALGFKQDQWLDIVLAMMIEIEQLRKDLAGAI